MRPSSLAALRPQLVALPLLMPVSKAQCAARRARAAISAVALFTIAAQAQAQQFEGAISMRMGAIGGAGAPQDVEFLTRGARGVRVNAAGPMGAMAMISLPAEQKIYVLIDAQNVYMELPPGTDVATLTDTVAPKITRTGKRETIAGYPCEHVTIATKRDTTDVCMARGLGPFLHILSGMRIGGARPPAWQRSLAADGGFPLKVVGADGKVALEVTKIEKRKLPAALFVIPPNYTKVDMPGRRGSETSSHRSR